jgi:protein-disulfide isomerase
MKDPTLRKIIQQDVLDGREVGVRGTPTIFINGRRLKKRSLEGFQSIIDKLLQNLAKTATKPSS